MFYRLSLLITLVFALFVISCGSAEPAQNPGLNTPSPDEIFANQNSKVWSYQGEEDGPDKWGSINSDWRKCNLGKQQSPIDIVNAKTKDLGKLHYNYASMPLRMKTINGMLKIFPNGEQYVNYRDKRYGLQYILVHTPSEHHTLGREYAMEVQFFHQSDTSDKWIVLAVLVEQGVENSEFSWISDNIPPNNEKNNPEGVAIDPSLLIPHAKSSESPIYTDDFYQYNGSQTTPPCTENVLWFVGATPLKASKAQIDAFQAKIPRSNRPVIKQERTVYQGSGLVDLIAQGIKERQEEAAEESEESEIEAEIEAEMEE